MSEELNSEIPAPLAGVSRETIHRLRRYAALLEAWNSRINLVADSTLSTIWERHFADSAQLLPLIPGDAKRIVDLGSGAGFPGLVLALCLSDRAGLEVILIESIAKKCRFLEAVIAETGAPARVIQARAEAIAPIRADVVTARAVAPLAELLALARPFMGPQSLGLFLKGRKAEEELAAAQRFWQFGFELVKSETDAQARIVVVRSRPHVRR
ncbi:MAG: 16S rRNA (guanine(527)-N(7))-methyltransferase RsmG [Alphaproteobacteria bacterium]|nr:16S rRNA (guanine(527)-N(7))-methyltransferase RsmG [Alphaproteobacteria bacterium]